jgi:hypothetical protein
MYYIPDLWKYDIYTISVVFFNFLGKLLVPSHISEIIFFIPFRYLGDGCHFTIGARTNKSLSPSFNCFINFVIDGGAI